MRSSAQHWIGCRADDCQSAVVTPTRPVIRNVRRGQWFVSLRGLEPLRRSGRKIEFATAAPMTVERRHDPFTRAVYALGDLGKHG